MTDFDREKALRRAESIASGDGWDGGDITPLARDVLVLASLLEEAETPSLREMYLQEKVKRIESLLAAAEETLRALRKIVDDAEAFGDELDAEEIRVLLSSGLPEKTPPACDACGSTDGTAEYRGYHDEGSPMRTCDGCGSPLPFGSGLPVQEPSDA